jgi:hypothetical protein
MNHCTIKILGFLALLFLVSSPIRAQTHPCGGGAGNGEVQVGEDPGSNGIAPTPLCDWVKGNQPQAPQPPPVQWINYWGAIVTDPVKSILGTAVNMASESQAEQAAFADCKAKGGTACKLDIAYLNKCAAMVAGATGYNTKAGATVDDAIQAAMTVCSAATSNCHAYYTACSLPVRVQ